MLKRFYRKREYFVSFVFKGNDGNYRVGNAVCTTKGKFMPSTINEFQAWMRAQMNASDVVLLNIQELQRSWVKWQ